ncbi:hypothetical protein GF373_15275, partial [bacterium]|nr:hypothetical protein [bacterium]
PRDIAQWTTLVKGHWFWDRAFLFSNYHLEHHYFPAIPCYNLPKLQKLLHPLYERHGMAYHTYGEILYGWFIKNHAPHTDWSQPHQPNQPTGKEEVPTSDLLFP